MEITAAIQFNKHARKSSVRIILPLPSFIVSCFYYCIMKIIWRRRTADSLTAVLLESGRDKEEKVKSVRSRFHKILFKLLEFRHYTCEKNAQDCRKITKKLETVDII